MSGVEPGALLPEIALAVGAVAALLTGSWTPRRRQWVTRWIAVAATAAAVAAAAAAMARPAEVTATGGYALDLGTHLARLVVAAGTLVTALIAADHVAGHRRESEFHVLLLLGALGTVVMAGASDLLVLTAGYLLASIPIYALVGFGKDARGTEAALKYYLMGALSGVLLLSGVTVVFGAGGATDYATLAETLPAAPSSAVAVGTVALLAGLLFKSGAVPAHFWIPDATQGAPSPVAAFITTVPKIGALVAVYRFGGQALAGAAVDWPLFAAVLAAASMTLGNLAAFFQDDVRRLLAYSTISQIGYLLMAVAAARAAESALPSLLFYLAAYTVTNLGAFAVVCALPRARAIADYIGLLRRRPRMALSLIVCLLGLVGTPPTAVFIGKLTVFTAALDAGLGWLVVVAAVNTVASLFYYLRWILPVFRAAPAREGADGAAEPSGDVARWSAGIAVTAAAASLGLGVASSPVLGLLQSGALLP
ncbi:NADH-quinone oxidoreductase subunit N [Spinactinospora alkalitolerans]|nr:NADH-quinone oxidoreductase subunit N [Spinactinospora alkalitolerans]